MGLRLVVRKRPLKDHRTRECFESCKNLARSLTFRSKLFILFYNFISLGSQPSTYLVLVLWLKYNFNKLLSLFDDCLICFLVVFAKLCFIGLELLATREFNCCKRAKRDERSRSKASNRFCSPFIPNSPKQHRREADKKCS